MGHPGVEEGGQVEVGHSVMGGGHVFFSTFTLPRLEEIILVDTSDKACLSPHTDLSCGTLYDLRWPQGGLCEGGEE